MALGDSELHPGAKTARNQFGRAPSPCSPWPEPSRSSKASSETLPGEEDPDTIVVDVAHHRTQLPTPAESTMDASFEFSHEICTQGSLTKHRRVDHKSEPGQQNRDCIIETTLSEKGRSVSGETLVTSTSQSSLLRNGIAALDLPWSVTSLVQHGSTGAEDTSRQTSETRVSHGEEDNLKAKKAAAKRAKMEENAKLWDTRKREAEGKATRRSSRASILEKAGEAVSDITTSVLGKRPREALDRGKDRLGDIKRRASLRPRSVDEPILPTTAAFQGPIARERRLSDSDLGKPLRPVEAFTVPRKPVPLRKDKRWLNSGLYTGQKRDFDGRLSESKNKRKHNAAPPINENKILPLPMFVGERIMKYGRDFKLPYDVFSPLPPGQPRPDEWRKTNKNVFVGDAAQVWRHSKPREHSTCMCTPETGCHDHCMNRCMFYECDNGNCNLAECSNRSFQSLAQRSKKGGKYNVGVEVIETRDRGFGVRSNRTFEPNQIIVEYTGEIITQDECDKRMRTLYKNNECYYLMLFDQNMIIDATRGSIARFVNHSCEPNCRMEKWTVGGKPHMALFAGDKGIMTGDELTYDYNFDPFSQKNVQECRCGSSKCRGVLGPKPKDERKPKADKDLVTTTTSKLAGAKRKIAEIFDEGAERWNKKARIAATGSAMAAIKKATASGSSSKNPARARVYSSSHSSATRTGLPTALFKKPALRAASLSASGAISRRPSMLRRIVNGAKGKATSRRVVSNASASERLFQGETKQPLTRKDSVAAKAASIRRNVVRTVRDLEEHAANFTEGQLTKLSRDLDVKAKIGGFGLVAICKNWAGETVLLRADFDALPVAEKTGLEYASKKMQDVHGDTKPVMHACGHDFHVTSLLAAAGTLLKARDAWSARIIFPLQPAKERGTGSSAMVNAGLYDPEKHACPVPDVVLGQHVMPYRAGSVETKSGTTISAADSFRVIISGSGGHGSQPHRTIDPVVIASHIVMRLQTICSREVPPDETAVVTVGSIQVGDTENITSAEAVLKIDTRSVTQEWRQRILASVKRIVKAECDAAICPKDPVFERTTFSLTDNDQVTDDASEKSFSAYFKGDHKSTPKAEPGSEDVSILASTVNKPCCFWFFGGTDAKEWDERGKNGTLDEIPVNHSPFFAPVLQSTFKTGIDALVVATLTFVGKPDAEQMYNPADG